ncbi:MAG: hypothetical protein JW888_03955 [Pirellulales bacterium]|nr:hypothetical protein [Pirellulales bacterium]
MSFHDYWFVGRKHLFLLVGLSALLFVANGASGGIFTWDGGSGLNPAMDAGENWVGDVAPDFFNYNLFDPSSLVFTGSTNTSPTVPVDPIDPFNVARSGDITFDSGASAFTIGPADADHYLYIGSSDDSAAKTLLNNSTATQTLGAVGMHVGTVNAASGAMVFNYAFDVGGGNTETGYDVTIAGDNDITFNGGLTGAGTSTSAGGILKVDMREQRPDTTYAYGRAYITADSAVDMFTYWAGQLRVRYGSLRISANNALGDPNTKTIVELQGTLELTGDITVPENIQFNGKAGTEPIIRNVSGNNTMTGTFTGATGGGNYYFRSDAGKVTIASDLLCPGTGTRRFELYGAGDGEIQGNVGNDGTRIWTYFRKYGTGTWTLSGENTYTATTYVYEGTIALAGTGSINETGGVRLTTADTALDVSGLTSGLFTLGATKAQWLDGYGTVVGNVSVSTGSTIRAGTNSVAQLEVAGDLTLQTDAYNNWQLGSLTDDLTGTGGTDFDQIVVSNGDLDLGTGAILRVYFGALAAELRPNYDPLDSFWSSTHTWKVIDVDADNGGTNSGGTTFGSIVTSDLTLPDGMSLSTTVGTTTGVDLGDVFLVFNPGIDIPGDATGNGIVDEEDAVRLAEHWGFGPGATWSQGDFDEDGYVGPKDASIMAGNWGYGTGSESAAVPEPSMLMLLLSLLLPVALRRARS